ncbi:MAG TPA: PilZ domain-containing protein [Terriglobales bacterium]|nr:PilZ domain-containing protein [Terriglobales bacterium]
MTFQALLVSKDEEVVGVLTAVLSGFGLGVQPCGYPDAVERLSEEKFDAVLVDFDDPHNAALVLQNASQPATRNSAVTIALLSDKAKVRKVFGAGANFVLYKPVSEAQAQVSLRAATALIKRERRRSFRVPVQVPLQLRVENGAETEAILLDLSEGGMDVLAAQPLYPSAAVSARFSLPGAGEIEPHGEVAWANPNGQSGVRFTDIGEPLRNTLRQWVAANAPELPPDDPEPVSECKLTDLSLGGCYVETSSPFPEHSGIVLSLRVKDVEVQAEGMVRVMHPEFGMGIEFATHTPKQRQQVEGFIELLTSHPGTVPQLSVTPRALSAGQEYEQHVGGEEEMEDPLLELLRRATALGQEEFLKALRQQRHSEEIESLNR